MPYILYCRESLEILMETFYKEAEKVTDLVLRVCIRCKLVTSYNVRPPLYCW